MVVIFSCSDVKMGDLCPKLKKKKKKGGGAREGGRKKDVHASSQGALVQDIGIRRQ